MIKGRRRVEQELEAEIEALRPYLGLAREIRDEVARLGGAEADGLALARAIEAIPVRERAEIARQVFERLTAVQQWEVLERTFGDEELRSLLEGERATVRANAEAIAGRQSLVAIAQLSGVIDTADIPEGERLTLGLFVESDARAATEIGRRSTRCARRVVLQARGDCRFAVIEDVFNPDGGYYVTPSYDEETWRSERLRPHELVGVGSFGPKFEPVLHLGGRVDFERQDAPPADGRLHLGYALLGEIDVFTAKGAR